MRGKQRAWNAIPGALKAEILFLREVLLSLQMRLAHSLLPVAAMACFLR